MNYATGCAFNMDEMFMNFPYDKLDIVDNNVTFILPTHGRFAEMHVKRTYGEDFKRARRSGKWRDVDFLSSGFSGNEIVLNIKSGNFIKSKTVYVDKNIKNKITENTNKGKQYC
mgnify:CR=1 FL=1